MLDDNEIRKLLILTAASDQNAFAVLYQKTAPLMLGIASRIVGRKELAEDILHDAYVKIWKAAASFDPMTPSPVGWLTAIVRNRAIDFVSSADQSRIQSLQIDEETDLLDFALGAQSSAESEVEQQQSQRWLEKCLKELVAAERQAIVLAYMHGLSHSDLSAHLAKPLGTIKSWIRRGMENLRDCMESCGSQWTGGRAK